MGKNGILKNKAGEQIFPATTADQVAWDKTINLKQAISEKLGAPWVATTVAQMTDKTRIYIYTGSESGYTKGNWYYWNGSSWVSGGVYNSVAVETDKTLTVAGKAADGEVVGQEIGQLKESIDALAAATGINIDNVFPYPYDLEVVDESAGVLATTDDHTINIGGLINKNGSILIANKKISETQLECGEEYTLTGVDEHVRIWFDAGSDKDKRVEIWGKSEGITFTVPEETTDVMITFEFKQAEGTITQTLIPHLRQKHGKTLKDEISDINNEMSQLKTAGSGLTAEQKRYIIMLFKNAVFSENMVDTVTALEDSFNTIPATGIKLNPTTIKFASIGDTQKITATLTPDTATSSIIWESSNTDVVTVQKNGVATAVNDGMAAITATSGSATAKCNVTVNTKELYSVSNKVCNADFYEATGLKLGSDSANGYAKSWTLLANFSTTAGAIVYGLNTSAKGCDFGTNGANNAQLMWCSNTCTATRSANNNWCYALTHETNSNTITIYEYINDEFKKTVGVAAYNLPNASTYAGEICVGGKTSAAYVGTIYDLSIVMRKLTDDEILQFLKSGVY